MSSRSHPDSQFGSPHASIWLFLFLVAVYLLSYSGAFHAIDEVSVAAMTESLVKHGRVSTDQIWWSQEWAPSQGRIGPDGHLYSKKGIGSALLGAPFYWLALQLPALGAVRAMMLANALVTALTGWLVYRCILRLGYRPLVAVLTALGFGLGTMAWPYAKYFFSEPLTALGLILAFWGWLAVDQTGKAGFAACAGSGLGLALLAKVANLVTWPLFLVLGLWTVIHRWKDAPTTRTRRWVGPSLAFLLPLVVAGLALIVYNVARTGQAFDLGYAADETFSTPLWQGLAGLLLSPGKSLFLYSPLLLAALLGIPALLHRSRAAALLALGLVVTYLLLYAGWFMWWGGWSWGPRFMVPLLPFLSLFLAPVIDWSLRPSRWLARGALAALGLVSVAVQLLGVVVDFNRYLLLLYQRGIDSAAVNFRVDLSPLLGHWRLLGTSSWDLAWMVDLTSGQNGSRLLWPLALLAAVIVGWSAFRWAGSASQWLFVVVGVGLMAASAVVVSRLPASASDWEAGCQTLSETLQVAARSGDVLIADLLPYGNHLELATSLLERYKARLAYWGWAREEPVSSEREALLAELGREYRRLWLALDTTPEGDPASTTERWLDAHAFRIESRWLSPAMRLVHYQLSASSLSDAPQKQLDYWLGDRLRLLGYSLSGPDEVRAGYVLTLSLFWQAEEPVAQDYVVFVQLLDQKGALWAQVDRQPGGGFWPTSTWQSGEMVRDNYGLALPSDLLPGSYRIIAGLYLPVSMERLPVRNAEGTRPGDYVPVANVTVVEEGGR